MFDLSADSTFFQKIFDSIPALIMVVDPDGRLQYINDTFSKTMGLKLDDVFDIKGGDVFRCSHRNDVEQGCGHGDHCKANCVVRGSLDKSLAGQKTYRKKMELTTNNEGVKKTLYMLVTSVPIEYDENPYALITLEDLSDLIQLNSLLPICANCKKIRNDDNYWESVETYISTRSDISFSHCLCADCADHLYGEQFGSFQEPDKRSFTQRSP